MASKNNKKDRLSEKNLMRRIIEAYPMGRVFSQVRLKILDEDGDPQTRVVDYAVCDDKNITLFEFDGPFHFMDAKKAERDQKLGGLSEKKGAIISGAFTHGHVAYASLIRVPYFVQMDQAFFHEVLEIKHSRLGTVNLIMDLYQKIQSYQEASRLLAKTHSLITWQNCRIKQL